jgi:hypothetical protein
MGDGGEAEAVLDAAEQVCRKLSGRLERLVTVVGYRALLGRALHLAGDEFPYLQGVRAGANEDACFDGLREKTEGVEPAMLHVALTTVFGTVIGLLTTFIGDDLTARLVREVWPRAPFDGIDPQRGGEVRR